MDEIQANNHQDGAGGSEASEVAMDQFFAIVNRAAVQECRRDKRTTVTGDDLVLAMTSLGFNDYVGPRNLYLHGYRERRGTRPRIRHSTRSLVPAPVPVVPTVEAEAHPPSPGLTLQLGPPSVGDVTELGLHADMYAVWPGAAPAGASLAPPAADNNE